MLLSQINLLNKKYFDRYNISLFSIDDILFNQLKDVNYTLLFSSDYDFKNNHLNIQFGNKLCSTDDFKNLILNKNNYINFFKNFKPYIVSNNGIDIIIYKNNFNEFIYVNIIPGCKLENKQFVHKFTNYCFISKILDTTNMFLDLENTVKNLNNQLNDFYYSCCQLSDETIKQEIENINEYFEYDENEKDVDKEY